MPRRLTIVLLTYNRLEYAQRTLRHALTNIVFDGPMRIHIADDGSPNHEKYVEPLLEIAEDFSYAVTVTNAERGGYGKNYNLACQVVHDLSDCVMPLEDDWEINQPLNLNAVTDALEDPRIGCVRLGYLGYTQRLYGEVITAAERNWLLLDKNSPEPHVFTGHPRVETVKWQQNVGAWPEGIAPGATEWEVAHRPESRERVVWPMELGHPLFEHIGTIRTVDLG